MAHPRRVPPTALRSAANATHATGPATAPPALSQMPLVAVEDLELLKLGPDAAQVLSASTEQTCSVDLVRSWL